jgi:hypothetical protein
MSRIHRQAPTVGNGFLRPALRRAALLGALAVALISGALAGIAALVTPAMASAPIALDTPENGDSPMIAYDPTTQTTYVAWSDPAKPGVDLCVLPPGSTACEGGAPVLLEDSKYPGYSAGNHPGLGGLVVLPNGEAVVIGTPVSTGSVAWASPAGGATFLSGSHGLQNGGKFISPVSLYYTVGNAVALSNSDVGLLDDYDHFYSFFSDSPFAGPESPALPEKGNSNPGGLFPTKGQDTDGPDIAAEPAPAPAPEGTDVVVGVGDNYGGPNKSLPGCFNEKEGSGYGVSVGKVEGTSNATGTLNHAGLPKYEVLACSALSPVLAQGGVDGIGVLEQEGSAISEAGSDWQMAYRPFIATATGGSFGAPVELSDITGEVLDGVDALDVSDDSGTGVYAYWEDGNTVLDYSPNGGAGWDGPVASPIPYTAHGVIAGVGNGNAEIAYDENLGTGTQVFLQAVNYQQLALAPTAITTTQTAGTTTGASITIPAGTVGESDKATIAGAHAAGASGTVTYGLYSSSSCAASSQVFSSTGNVTGGVAGPSAGLTTGLAPGTYYWEAAYSGNSTNDPSASACGSEVLTVAATAVANSGYTIKSIVGNSNGTVTITFVPTQSGEATLEVTVPTASIASTSAVDAKSKKCKKSQVKIKGKCLPSTTVAGKTSASGTAGVPLKLTVYLSGKIKALLKKGKTVHLLATLTYKSALGGTPTVTTYHVTVKGKRPHPHKR